MCSLTQSNTYWTYRSTFLPKLLDLQSLGVRFKLSVLFHVLSWQSLVVAMFYPSLYSLSLVTFRVSHYYSLLGLQLFFTLDFCLTNFLCFLFLLIFSSYRTRCQRINSFNLTDLPLIINLWTKSTIQHKDVFNRVLKHYTFYRVNLDYILNNYPTKRLKNKGLLTNDKSHLRWN